LIFFLFFSAFFLFLPPPLSARHNARAITQVGSVGRAEQSEKERERARGGERWIIAAKASSKEKRQKGGGEER